MLLKEVILSTEDLEPETIRTLIPGLNESDYEKLAAIRTVLFTRFFFEDMYIFEDIVLALNNQPVRFNILQGCSPEQIWYAVELVSQLRPEIEYSNEVQHYAKWMMNDAGVFIYPLQFTDLENPYYHKAVEYAKLGQIGEDSIESVQAAKYLVIQEYIAQMKTQTNIEWR